MSKKKDDLNLKGPDAFQVKTAESLDFALKNSKILYTAVGVAALIALVSFGVQQLRQSAEVDRQSMLAEIDIQREAEQKVFSDKKTEFEKEIDSLKLAQKENKEGFDEAKLKSLEAKVAGLNDPDYSKSNALYQEFYSSNKDSPEGWVAGLRFASGLAESNKLTEAEKIVKGVFELSLNHRILRHQSGMILISLYEDQGKYAEAVATADQLLSSAGEGLKPQYLLAKARGLYLLKKGDEAKQVADEILKDFENSQESEKARGLKALIN